MKKGFIKGKTLRLLRTNSVKENFESMKRDFQSCLLDLGYPLELIETNYDWHQFLIKENGFTN